jgi:hypothetical protein
VPCHAADANALLVCLDAKQDCYCPLVLCCCHGYTQLWHHATQQPSAMLIMPPAPCCPLQDDKVVGVAFQNLPHAENIGYIIPTPVVKLFLAEVARWAGQGRHGQRMRSCGCFSCMTVAALAS